MARRSVARGRVTHRGDLITEGPASPGVAVDASASVLGMTSSQERHACPCCGYLTLSERPPGTFAICPVCRWEDDNVQYDDVNYAGGANRVSLRQAQENFRAHGKSDSERRGDVRPPLPEER
jgi:hypothetical protein